MSVQALPQAASVLRLFALSLVVACAEEPLQPPSNKSAAQVAEPAADVVNGATSPPVVVSNLKAASGRTYAIDAALAANDVRYTDKTYRFRAPVPGIVAGKVFIRTANADRTAKAFSTSFLTFDVNQDVIVYVADQERTVRPAWLAGWTDTGQDLLDTYKLTHRYRLFSRSFPKGRVTLGSNYWGDGANMYSVVVASAGGKSVSNPAPPANPPGKLAAFPGAEGWGATALQSCRTKPLQVIAVQNLHDSGPGSLRQALADARTDRFTIITFRTGGYIDLSSRLRARTERCLYVAGQTAPGGGITIRGPDGIRLEGRSWDVVFRHLRFRLGARGSSTSIGVYVSDGRRVMLDHLSVSWTTEKLIAISAHMPDSVVDISLQRSIMSEALDAHPTALQLTGDPRDSPPNARLSIHRNLLAHNSHRNPVLGTRNVQFVNNVVYNWFQGASYAGGPANVAHGDFVNNAYKGGPMTDSRYLYEVTVDCGTRPGYVTLYVAGNIGPHNRNASASSTDQWNGGRVTACYYTTGGAPGRAVPATLRVPRAARLPLPSTFRPIELGAFAAEADVLGDVGANGGLACDGTPIRRPDAVDARILAQYRAGTGVGKPPRSETQLGGYPSLSGGTACPDSDSDGMPDAWEKRYPAAAAAGGDADGDGYLNIEEYLNATVPG